ncbi:MAG: hypothetical protein ACTSU5_02980 [Promethearchaeota archaeon]
MPDQVNEFFMKRAKLSEDIAEQHYRDNELKKCLTLLNQAYQFYTKAGSEEDRSRIKARFEEVKAKL